MFGMEAAFKECFGCEALEELFSFPTASQGVAPVAIVSPVNIQTFTAASLLQEMLIGNFLSFFSSLSLCHMFFYSPDFISVRAGLET